MKLENIDSFYRFDTELKRKEKQLEKIDKTCRVVIETDGGTEVIEISNILPDIAAQVISKTSEQLRIDILSLINKIEQL